MTNSTESNETAISPEMTLDAVALRLLRFQDDLNGAASLAHLLSMIDDLDGVEPKDLNSLQLLVDTIIVRVGALVTDMRDIRATIPLREEQQYMAAA